MKEETKGLYLAVVLSAIAILAVNYIWPKPDIERETAPEVIKEEVKVEEKTSPQFQVLETKDALKKDARISIANDKIHGSIRVRGGRFDNLFLNNYKQTLAENSENVELFSPAETQKPYYAEFGWLSDDKNLKLPNNNTEWKVIGSELTPQTPITLEWNNGQGVKFVRKISIDNNYMFNIEQIVENNSGKTLSLYPFGLISKFYDDKDAETKVVHEGMIGVLDGSLKEIKAKDLDVGEKEKFESKGGWAGFGERYWFSAITLNNNAKNFVSFNKTNNKTFQTDYVGNKISVENGSIATANTNFFAGAKEIALLDEYADNMNIEKFDLAVDFGWYYFLTKPFFYILDFLYKVIGNMGWAILLFAALLRLVMFPIANKSYESMSKMKKIQPKVAQIQETYKNDKMRQQQAMMELYKKEKINPASGCLPMFIQIPVFFSLYKVLNIAIEIRHAPFIGWIKDLSAPDPMTISAMTGIPLPSIIDLGVWPILMGLTMYLQQKLSPKPANKDQARMFAMMPVIFTFMLGHFASGLVIYWTLSNVLSIIQQKAIMRKVGVD